MQTTFNKTPAAIYFLLAGISVAILPSLSYLPIGIAILCYSLILWRLLHDVGRVALPGRFVLFLLLICLLLGVISQYHTIVGRNAGSALLSTLLCLKLLELKSLRDVSVIVQLACFAILAGFLFSQSIFVAVAMFSAVVLLLSALVTFQHAKAGYRSSVAIEKSHLLFAARMVLFAIPLTLILFVLFPRINASLWAMPDDALQGKTGLSDEMSPGRISRLSSSTAVAFRVQFESAIPDKAVRYWRGPVLSAFDGYTWTAPKREQYRLTAPPVTPGSAKTQYSVTLEPHHSIWLLALDIPTDIPPDLILSAEMQLQTRKPVQKLLKYNLSAYTRYKLLLSKNQPVSQFLHVPANTAPKARKFIQALQADYHNSEQLVNAVLNHFKNNDFYYTRSPPRLFDDPIDEFLFTTKRGYCEHFASTFTILMRLAGIPARVVTGYQGGEMNPLSNYMIVRQSDAHAWSEIYLPDKGWLRIDPTAVIPTDKIENPADVIRFRPGLIDASRFIDQQWSQKTLKQFRFAMDMLNNSWNQWVIGYNDKKQKSFFDFIGMPNISWSALGYLLATILSLITLIIALKIFSGHRIRYNPAQSIYRQFLKKLQRLKLEKSPAEGALAFSQRIALHFPKQENELLTIAEIYNNIRYGQPDKEALKNLKAAIRHIHFK